jgi:hypothetical protein
MHTMEAKVITETCRMRKVCMRLFSMACERAVRPCTSRRGEGEGEEEEEEEEEEMEVEVKVGVKVEVEV